MQKRSNSVDLFTKKVMDYMTDDYICVDSKETIGKATQQLRDEKKSTLIIQNEQGVCGVITEKDIATKVVFQMNENTPVDQIMSAPVKYVFDDDLVFHAVGKMRKFGFRHLPVLNYNFQIIGIIQMNDALAAELGDIMNQIDQMTYDENDEKGLQLIKKQQLYIAEEMLERNISPHDISYLLSFLNNVIYRRSIHIAEKKIKEKNIIQDIPEYSVIVMGSGGRMESFLHPDQDNGIIYEDTSSEDPQKVDQYFEELAKHFTKTLDDCDIPFCKGNLMASNPLWRKSLPDWKKQINTWVNQHSPQDMRYIDMLYDFRSVHGKFELAEELRTHLIQQLQQNKILKFLYHSEEESNPAIGFFGQFILEREDPDNIGFLNLKHTGTLPLVESIRLYSIKHSIDRISTLGRLDELQSKEVFTEHEADFFKNAHRFLSNILLKNQVDRAKQGLAIQNFIDPKKLLDREVRVLKMYLKKIRDLKEKVRGDIGEEYF